jgi:hypothetical protein
MGILVRGQGQSIRVRAGGWQICSEPRAWPTAWERGKHGRGAFLVSGVLHERGTFQAFCNQT